MKDIMKNNQTVSVPIYYFIYFFVHTLKVNGNQDCLVANISQNIVFYCCTEDIQSYTQEKKVQKL